MVRVGGGGDGDWSGLISFQIRSQITVDIE